MSPATSSGISGWPPSHESRRTAADCACSGLHAHGRVVGPRPPADCTARRRIRRPHGFRGLPGLAAAIAEEEPNRDWQAVASAGHPAGAAIGLAVAILVMLALRRRRRARRRHRARQPCADLRERRALGPPPRRRSGSLRMRRRGGHDASCRGVDHATFGRAIPRSSSRPTAGDYTRDPRLPDVPTGYRPRPTE